MTVHGLTIVEALRIAPTQPLDDALVLDCIDTGDPAARVAEHQFRRAFVHGLVSVPKADRESRLNGVTGHIAESVVEAMLAEIGWTPLEHFTGPFSGQHGIELAMATADFEDVYAIEVKGTLAARGWPRLRAGDVPQLSAAWLGKRDNPGVESLGLEASGMATLAVLVHFHRRQWRAARSFGAVGAEPVVALDELS
ncbi:hypothetical protein [Pseudolysinimonas sp.]